MQQNKLNIGKKRKLAEKQSNHTNYMQIYTRKMKKT